MAFFFFLKKKKKGTFLKTLLCRRCSSVSFSQYFNYIAGINTGGGGGGGVGCGWGRGAWGGWGEGRPAAAVRCVGASMSQGVRPGDQWRRLCERRKGVSLTETRQRVRVSAA